MAIAKYRNYGCRIIDELEYKGMRTVFLENELLRVGILLDKGADIFEFLHKPTDTDFLWRSPNGLINPKRFNPTTASSSGRFLDSYHGGWQEILPGGGPTIYRGAELGLHGEVAQLGWDFEIIDDQPERIAVRTTVQCVRTPFHLERVMELEAGKPVLFIHEKLVNLSLEDQELMWGHHPAFGAPFLKEGNQLIIPAHKAEVHDPQFMKSGILVPGSQLEWPTVVAGGTQIDLSSIPGPDAGFGELLYLSELDAGWYAHLDPQKSIGFGLAWPVEIFPYLWFWLVYGGSPGYPWWDQVYVVALEPWTSIPNNFDQACERGTQAILKGGETREISLCAIAITDREGVKEIKTDGTII